MTNPGLSAYQAAKWAVSGFTEILARETASFGVRAISVEPGGMRTDWAANAAGAAENAPESTAEGSAAVDTEYESSVGEMRRMLGAYAGHEVGDPAKIAKVIVNLSRSETLPMHLLLGSDALAAFDAAENERRREADAWLAVSKSVDF
jgi:NAD(P)-dependent dehydrogenase (short-subunit alcohol dehydrogenase family)